MSNDKKKNGDDFWVYMATFYLFTSFVFIFLSGLSTAYGNTTAILFCMVVAYIKLRLYFYCEKRYGLSIAKSREERKE